MTSSQTTYQERSFSGTSIDGTVRWTYKDLFDPSYRSDLTENDFNTAVETALRQKLNAAKKYATNGYLSVDTIRQEADIAVKGTAIAFGACQTASRTSEITVDG